MSGHIVFLHASAGVPRTEGRGDRGTFLVDVRAPCGLACPSCPRRGVRPSFRALEVARGRLLAAAVEGGIRTLRAVFYGGDPLLSAARLTQVAEEVRSACAARGVAFDAFAMTPGVALTRQSGGWLAEAGVRYLQVTLAGPRDVHDRLRPLKGGGGSFDRVLHGLKFCRDGLETVVRVEALPGDPRVEELANDLDEEGLFAAPNPIRLLVAPPASYREQARQLLDVAGR